MSKTLGERTARLEEYYIACEQHFKDIKEHLETLNGDVAANSRFRLQQQTIWAVVGVMYVTIATPVIAIAVAALA